jgi:hypothetical protein
VLLIEKIQSALDTDTYLGFLNVLGVRQLNTLLDLVEAKTRGPATGDAETKDRAEERGQTPSENQTE